MMSFHHSCFLIFTFSSCVRSKCMSCCCSCNVLIQRKHRRERERRKKNHFLLIFLLLVCVAALCCGLITLWLRKPLIILSTSVIGSYATIRGLIHFAGKRWYWPDEWGLLSIYPTGNTPPDSVHWQWFVYIGVIVLLASAGGYVQYNYGKPPKPSYVCIAKLFQLLTFEM